MNKDELLYVFNELVTNATKFKPQSLQRERNEAYQQIKGCINEAFAIPDTSEREASLEEIIIKMQKEIHRLHEPPLADRGIPSKNMSEVSVPTSDKIDERFVEEKARELLVILPWEVNLRMKILKPFIRSLLLGIDK